VFKWQLIILEAWFKYQGISYDRLFLSTMDFPCQFSFHRCLISIFQQPSRAWRSEQLILYYLQLFVSVTKLLLVWTERCCWCSYIL